MIAHADPAAIVRAVDAGLAAFRAAFIAALVPSAGETPAVSPDASAGLPSWLDNSAPIVPAQAPKPRNRNTEKTNTRRAKLRAMGLSVKTPGRIEDLEAAHRCNQVKPGETVSPVSPSFFRSELLQKEDDDEDARARENLVSRRIGPEQAEVAERIAGQVTQIVKEAGKWPPNGWNPSVVVEQLRKLLGRGVNENVLLDQVRISTSRASGRVYSFQFFERDILRAHEKATREPELPLARSFFERRKPIAATGTSWRTQEAIRQTLERRREAVA